MSAWLVVVAAGLATYLTRLSFLDLVPQSALPLWFAQALRFVPPAVLCAIIFPELLIRDGELHVGLENTRLVAGVLAILVAWRTRQVLLTIAAGMTALWGMQFLAGGA